MKTWHRMLAWGAVAGGIEFTVLVVLLPIW
jgi:hypothetical protein